MKQCCPQCVAADYGICGNDDCPCHDEVWTNADDELHCICGNNIDHKGFHACHKDGWISVDFEEHEGSGFWRCDNCGRVIQDPTASRASYKVVKRVCMMETSKHTWCDLPAGHDSNVHEPPCLCGEYGDHECDLAEPRHRLVWGDR